MDFGLAKTVQGDSMTQTGMMIGTMEYYVSPEQAMGSDVDARSGIFTMGLIFYELLTGNIPFRVESAIASLVKAYAGTSPASVRCRPHDSASAECDCSQVSGA